MNNTIPYAVRPWDGPFAKSETPEKRHKRYIPAQMPPQREIDACLSCPLPDCDGSERKCRSYRAHYVAKRVHQ